MIILLCKYKILYNLVLIIYLLSFMSLVRQGLSSNLGFTKWPDWLTREYNQWPCHCPSTLELQAHVAVPSFLHTCQESKPRSSCLPSKHFTYCAISKTQVMVHCLHVCLCVYMYVQVHIHLSAYACENRKENVNYFSCTLHLDF